MNEEEEQLTCESCQASMDEDSAHSTHDSRLVCSDCVLYCENCETAGDEMDDWASVDQERWCQSCAYDQANYCDGCNEYTTEYMHHAIDSGLSYCDDCSGHLHYCEDCGENYDSGTCEEHDGSASVHNYSYRPDPIFHTTADNERLFFGFELEMEFNNHSTRREAADYASVALDNQAYLKEDGSLDTGFELVTHPMSFEYLMAEAYEVWDVIGKLNRVYDARSYHTNTCGFHIHISRTGFNGGAHMHRFLNLIYSNEFLFSKLAGRKSDRWAKFDDVAQMKHERVYDEQGNFAGYNSIPLGRSFKSKIMDGQSTDRYSAVNTQNRETLELRIFKGTLSQTALAAHIQLAHAAVEYTRTLSVLDVRNGALTSTEFITYIETCNNTLGIYKDLWQRLEHKQLAQASV